MGKENKVQFNLKNVHYAVLEETENGVTWGTPVAVPGAVTLTLDPQGEVTPFHADGIVFYRSIANNGYAGDLEMARFPDKMRQDIWGLTLGATSKVLSENANVEPKPFAMLYQIDGDADEEYFVLYNCTGTRPGIGSTTNTENKEPQTQTSNIAAVPLADGFVMARTTSETPAEVKANWFNSVFRETASEETVEPTTEDQTTEDQEGT